MPKQLEALQLTSRIPTSRKAVYQSGLTILLALVGSVTHGQSTDATARSSATPNGSAPNETGSNQNTNSPASPSKPWLVRDPATGRLFQQQLVPVSVPVTRWEARTVEQTVYEPRVTTQVQQVPQTTYAPNTQYVMQPKVTGWWNPFMQPVQAYQYVPVTNWSPQTQQVPNPVVTQQWVPRQQKIVVYQPIQATEVHQRLVQTEVPQPQTAPAATAYAAAPRQPLFRFPISAQQPVLPWAPAATNGYGTPYAAPASSYAATTPPTQSGWRAVEQASSQSSLPNAGSTYAPANSLQNASQSSPYTPPVTPPQYATNGLRPIAPTRSPLVLPPLSLPRFAASPYSAPLQTTTSVGNTASRDVLQSGMQPTVLR
jgi:hypothetical protein